MAKTDAAAIVAVLLVFVDGVMTIPFWHLETNPVLLELGPRAMLFVKTVAGLSLLLVWFKVMRTSEYRKTGSRLVWSLLVLYIVVVATNAMALAA